ncbi:uncharacterized protein [Argopecten irradians]|uniref:uncharacterized protein n=1 Tax=Argopecten irradians TaxID=31199 RepID=UPI0037181B84
MAGKDVCDGDSSSISVPALMCSDCETEEQVGLFCQECQLNFCEQCRNHHLKRKKTKSHNVVPVRQALYRTLSRNRHMCLVHSGVTADCWCETCNSFICSKCIPSHKKHNWSTIDDYMVRGKKNIRAKIDAFRSTLMKYRTAMNDDVRCSEYVMQCTSHLREDVCNQASIICQEVNKMKEDLLNEITIFQNKETSKHTKNETKMIAEMTALNGLITKADQELKCCDSAPSVAALLQKLRSDEGTFECPENNRSQPPVLTRPKLVDRSKLVSLFGQLEFPSTDKHEKVVYEVKAKYLKTNTYRKILAICVQEDGNIWVSIDGNRFLMLIDEYLETIKKSCDTEFNVVSMALYKNTDIVFTRFMNSCVQRLMGNGDRMVTVADLYPYYAKGVCVNSENRVLVCAVSNSKMPPYKIFKMTARGQILMDISPGDDVRENLHSPYRLTSVDTGEIFIVDTAADDHRVVCIDKQKDRYLTWAWRGEGIGSVDPLGIACDKHACYVTDAQHNKIYVLPKKCNTAAVLLDESSRETGPRCITVDRKGIIWVGCNNGIILKIER